MATECWRWPEFSWVSPTIDWEKAEAIAAGVDVGSLSSQAAIMCDGELHSYASVRNGFDSGLSGEMAMKQALEASRMKPEVIRYVVSTGYGRLNVPSANKAMTEIVCHAQGARYIYGPTVRTVVDMGGQDCKVIECNATGKVTDFLMNDRCASGSGRGIETFADLVALPIQDIGPMSLDVEEDPEPVSSTCYTFANSQGLGLMRLEPNKNKILAAYCYGMAHRIYTLLMRIKPKNDLAVTGGLAKNVGIVSRVRKLSGLTIPEAEYDPQIAGAVGAALFAAEALMSERVKGAK